MTWDSSVEFLFSLSCILLFGKVFNFLRKRYGVTVSLFFVALVFASVYPLTFLQWLFSPDAFSSSVPSIGIGYIIHWFQGSPAPVLILSAFYCGLLLFSNNKNFESNLFIVAFAISSFFLGFTYSSLPLFVLFQLLIAICLCMHFAPSFSKYRKKIGLKLSNFTSQISHLKTSQVFSLLRSKNFNNYKLFSFLFCLIPLFSLVTVVYQRHTGDSSLLFVGLAPMDSQHFIRLIVFSAVGFFLIYQSYYLNINAMLRYLSLTLFVIAISFWGWWGFPDPAIQITTLDLDVNNRSWSINPVSTLTLVPILDVAVKKYYMISSSVEISLPIIPITISLRSVFRVTAKVVLALFIIFLLVGGT